LLGVFFYTRMNIIAFDTETHLIKQGCVAPRLVCLTTYDGETEDILLREESLEWFRHALLDTQTVLVGHNVSYDLGVLAAEDDSLLPLIFEAIAAGRIKDTRIREQLLFLAQGRLTFDYAIRKPAKFNLAQVVFNHFKVDLSSTKQGEDVWRLRYHELDGTPLDDWPEEAILYALDDAKWTYKVYQKQAEPFEWEGTPYAGPDGVTNEDEQMCAAWGLHLITLWGIRTDAAQVSKLEKELAPRVAKLQKMLLDEGLMKERKVKGEVKRSKNMAALRERVEAAYKKRGAEAPLTEKGAVSTSRQVLKDSGDELLAELGSETNAEKLLTTYIPVLKQGTEHPLNPSYALLKESGRTSSFRPNIQNIPRAGGIREAYVPREGTVFVACDYSTLELCALSQVCLDLFGESEMAKAINSGRDLHLAVAANILGTNYEHAQERRKKGDKEVQEARQLAKALNFGFPGGMGAESFRAFARAGYSVDISEEQASSLKYEWLMTWPEMRLFFRHVSNLSSMGNDFTVKQHRSNRLRGGTNYCAGCNTFFQGLAADGAKNAIWEVAKECYVREESPLYGCRPVAFIHDELLVEVPEGIEERTAAADRLADIMVAAMKVYIPDVRIDAEPAAMRRWYKGAEEARDEEGRLLCWEPS
jgi:DNA polymerase-1